MILSFILKCVVGSWTAGQDACQAAKAYQDLAQVTSAISSSIANHKKAVTSQDGFSSRPISCRVQKTPPESEPLLFCVMACLCLLCCFQDLFRSSRCRSCSVGYSRSSKGLMSSTGTFPKRSSQTAFQDPFDNFRAPRLGPQNDGSTAFRRLLGFLVRAQREHARLPCTS